MRATSFIVVLSMVLLSTAALAGEVAPEGIRTEVSGLNPAQSPVLKEVKTDVPSLMDYQGTLTDGDGMALDTTVSITFTIYDDSTAGSAKWAEIQPAVVVSSGIFNVLLGSVNSIPDTVFKEPDRWLGVTVGDDPELVPRQRMAAVAYAFRAAEADTADHVRDGGAGSDGDWTIVGSDMYSTVPGNVGVGNANPLSKLAVRNIGANELQYALRLTNPDRTDTGGTATGILFETEPNDYGKGALVYERKRNFARGDFHFLQRTTGDYSFPTLSDAVVTINNDGYVGIGTTNPNNLLTLSGDPRISAGTSDGSDNSYLLIAGGGDAANWRGAFVGLNGNEHALGGRLSITAGYDNAATTGSDEGIIVFLTGPGASGTERMRINRVGNIGVGTTNPTEKLDVGGNIHASGTIASGGSIVIDGLSSTITGDTLEFYVTPSTSDTNHRALRLEPADDGGGVSGYNFSPNVIGGLYDNKVTSGVVGATISGGGRPYSDWHASGPWPNRVTDDFGTVGGGFDNTAGGGDGATVCGGIHNTANGFCATVCGGGGWESYLGPNVANGDWSTVGGGYGDSANAEAATVSGGYLNTAGGQYSTIGGGFSNEAEDHYNTIGGGLGNIARGSQPPMTTWGGATIAGGWQNLAVGNYTTISGGKDNRVEGVASTIGGGQSNEIWDAGYYSRSVIAGGYSNTIGDIWTFSNGENCFIGGGQTNSVKGRWSSLAGGLYNIVGASWGTIGGGMNNEVSGNFGTIAGGGRSDTLDQLTRNVVSGHYGTIGGGGYNIASGFYSTISGGRQNTAQGDYSFATGRRAKANHDGCFVWADSTDADFASIWSNEFAARASGGMRVIANNGSYGAYFNNSDGSGDGIRAIANVSSGVNWGAVYAINSGTSPAIYASATTAGHFAGNVTVTGTMSKGGGSFKIDHPLDPANKYLYHSFVESPDMKNIYDGVVALDSRGEAWVQLPDWFEALNSDFRYQLTAIGAPGPDLFIAQEISNNRFRISGGSPGMKVSWQVTGIRQDAFANAHRIPIEEDKSGDEKGKYLHPADHGMPETAGIDYETRLEKEMR